MFNVQPHNDSTANKERFKTESQGKPIRRVLWYFEKKLSDSTDYKNRILTKTMRETSPTWAIRPLALPTLYGDLPWFYGEEMERL